MNAPSEPWKDPWLLRVAYHGRGQSIAQIADVCGVCGRTIVHWMEKHGIETRTSPTDTGIASPSGYRVS